MALRAIPNMRLLRPADANETAAAWKVALKTTDRPVGLVLTRQSLPALAAADDDGVARGAYVMSRSWDGDPDALIIATGSEVQLALSAQAELAGNGIHTNVISMPSWDLFALQDKEYRDSVLLPSVSKRVSVEAGVTFGWERWIGDGGVAVGIDRFGASAPGPEVMDKLGINVAAVVGAVKGLL
jgi:transketolase